MNHELKVCTILGVVDSTTVTPFSNVPNSPKTTLVTEIIRIHVFFQAGEAAQTFCLSRGEKAINEGFLDADPNIILYGGNYIASGTGSYPLCEQYNYEDNRGNGLLVPENALSIAVNNTASVILNIYYRMREVPNRDLYLIMVNQGSSNN